MEAEALRDVVVLLAFGPDRVGSPGWPSIEIPGCIGDESPINHLFDSSWRYTR